MPLPLSPRQTEILHLIHAGLTNGQIAKRLKIEKTTVKIHRSNLYLKLHARNAKQAISRGQRLGILESA